MLPLPRGAVWQTLFLLCAVLFINEVRSEGRVVCYYTNWSVYRPGTAKFNPQNINPYLCTHLVYAFGGFTKDNQMKPFDKYQDIEQGGYAKFTGLKTYNKQLKTMIAIGGWNEASSRFSPLMANPERRQQFIKNILKFLRQNHFDGIDLDWEYPAQREGGKPRDRDNYAQFVQELRAEFERESQKTGRPRLLLTMAVPAGIENIEKGYDIPKLNKYLDWFNVLSYDFHSSHEPSANHHAPLYSLEEESEYNYDAELNIDYSIKYYLKAGADRDKLVLGIPTYGRSYTLINEESTELGAPSEGPGEQGDATREKGYLAYYEICQNMKDDPEWTVVQPNPNAMGPYAYRRNQWVGYDDEAIVRKKAQYVVEHGLGGIMFWAIDNDDFRGTCTGKPYPLIEAAKDAMLDGLGLGINEVAKPNVPKKPSRSRSRENSSSKLNRISGSSEGKGSGSRTTLSSGRRRVQSTTTTTTRVPETTIRLTNPEGSSLYIGGRVTTPAPPTTPDPGTDFKCEEEGFFQHPRDCKKYYWCLDSGPSGLGIVGHQFTCPSGLYFNPAADSCDFARNVPCKTKKATIAGSVSSTTTTTTTPRPTASPNRISAPTSRTSFFRTTTSTTPAPDEYEEEEEEEVEEAPAHAKDRDAEEDPQVIKELIELIRKVGGLEELEKHLLRKDDGTISIKGGSSESGVATTPTPISKNLYDKVLSKPNTFNSFRNRFTSASLFRKSGQTKTEDSTSTKLESEESQSSEGASSSGYSKYSSVVRSNSRQGPQNEGLDKLSEFDGFLKEKKQYVTINRHRGSFRGQEDEDEVEEKQTAEEVNENAEEEELSNRSKTTKRPTNTVTPSYASIKRMRPTTPRVESDEEAEGSDEEVKTVKENEEKRIYTSLNRNRGRFTTTESNQPADEVITNSNRYKYLERTRPTIRLQTSASSQDDDEEDQEDEQNVTVQLNGAEIDSTQKSTQTTIRNYANIGRRTTTTTTETPIITQETPTRYNLLENTFNNNETPEPILPTTTTTVTTANDSPALSITIKNTNPQLIPIATKQTITTTSQPIISTTNAAATTTTSNDIELIDTKSIITTLLPNFESDSKEALDLSLDVNSLIEKSALSPNESPKDMEPAETTTARTTKTTTTTETLTSTATTATATDTDQIPNADEVTNLNNNRTKTQYKFITRTRNVTKAATSTTTTNTEIDTENENENNKIFKETKKTSLKTGSSSSTDDKLSSNIRGNTVKYSGGRRQQQSNELLTRKNKIQNQQTDSTTGSANSITTTETAPTNEFLGTISSPRPFGYPRRRTRPNNTNPTSNADIQTTTTESSEDEPSIVKTRLTATSSSKNKVSSNSDVLQVQNGLETNDDEGSTTRTLTQTKLHTHTHVVNVVDGVSGVNTSNSLRHVVDKNHSLNINDTLSAQEKSDSRASAASVEALKSDFESKREQLANTLLENKSRVSVTQLNALTTNTKDDTLKTSKYRGKSLATESETTSAENSISTADEANFRSRGLKMVSEEKEELKRVDSGKESVSTAESNATSHTTSTYTAVVRDNGKQNTTSIVTTHANETIITDEGNGMVKIQTVYTTITNTDPEGTDQHKTNADEESEATKSSANAVNDSKGAKTYNTIDRSHAQTHKTKLGESYNVSNEDLGTQNTTAIETQDDGSVVRKTVYTTRMKDSSGKIVTTIVEETITTRTKIENYEARSNDEGGERKYQTITRRTDNTHNPTTETIHYNTIVRGSDGIKLNEDQTSSFYRNLAKVAKQAEQSQSRIYQGIARGGKTTQTGSENEATIGVVESKDSTSVEKNKTHAVGLERGSSKYQTINRQHMASGLEASNVTSKQRENSRFTDKTSKNDSGGFVGEIFSKEEVSGLEITEAKKEGASSATNISAKRKVSKFSVASVDGSLEVENTTAEIIDDEKHSTTPNLTEFTTESYITTSTEASTTIPEVHEVSPAAETSKTAILKEPMSSYVTKKNSRLYISNVRGRPTTTEIPVTTVIPEIEETTLLSSSEAEISSRMSTFTNHRGTTTYSVVRSEGMSNDTAGKTHVRPIITKTFAEIDSAAEKKTSTRLTVGTTSKNTDINSNEVGHKARGRPTTTAVSETTTHHEIEETTIVSTEASFKVRGRLTTTAVPKITTHQEIEETTAASTEANPKVRGRPTTTAVPETTTHQEIEETTIVSNQASFRPRGRPTTTAAPDITTHQEIEETTIVSTEASFKVRGRPTTTPVPEITTHQEIEETTAASTEANPKVRSRPTTTAVHEIDETTAASTEPSPKVRDGPTTNRVPEIEETTEASTEASFKVDGIPTTTAVSETTTHQEIEETTIASTEASPKVRVRPTTTAVPEITTHQEIEETTAASTEANPKVRGRPTTIAVPEFEETTEASTEQSPKVRDGPTTTRVPEIEETTEAATEASFKVHGRPTTTAVSETTTHQEIEETTIASTEANPKVRGRPNTTAVHEIEETSAASTEPSPKVRGRPTTTAAPEITTHQEIEETTIVSTEASFKVRGRPTTTAGPEITTHQEIEEATAASTKANPKVRGRPTTTAAHEIEETTAASTEPSPKVRDRPTTTRVPEIEETTFASTEASPKVRVRPTTTAVPEIEETTAASTEASFKVHGRPTITAVSETTAHQEIEETTIATTEARPKVHGKPTTTAVPVTTNLLVIEETTEAVPTEAVTISKKTELKEGTQITTTPVPENDVVTEIKTSIPSESEITPAPETTITSSSVNKITSTRHKVGGSSEVTRKNTAGASFTARSRPIKTSLLETTQGITTSTETDATLKKTAVRHRVNVSTEHQEYGFAETRHKVPGRPTTTITPDITTSTSSEDDALANRRNITRHRTLEKTEENSTGIKFRVRSRPTSNAFPETSFPVSSEGDTNENRTNGTQHKSDTSFKKTGKNSTENKFRVRSRPTTTTANSETDSRTFIRQRVGATPETIGEISTAIKSKVHSKPTTTASREITVIPDEATTSLESLSTLKVLTTPAGPVSIITPEISGTTVSISADTALIPDKIYAISEGSKAVAQSSTIDSPISIIAPKISETITLSPTERVTSPKENISKTTVTTEAPAATKSSTIAISQEPTTTLVPTSTLVPIQTATSTTSKTTSETEQSTTESAPIRTTHKSFKGNNHSFSGVSLTGTKVSTKEKEVTTEDVNTQVYGSKGRVKTTRGYVLENSDQISSSVEAISNHKTTSRTYSANDKSSSSTRHSSRREEIEDGETQSTTETPLRRTTYRGTYRPRKDKDDLSSLLALDVNKHRPYNGSQYNLGKRIYLDGIYKGEESSELSGKRSSYETIGAELGKVKPDPSEGFIKIGSGDAATQDISTKTRMGNIRNGTGSNHRRTTVIRRRINGSRNATRIRNEIVTANKTGAKLAADFAELKTVEGTGEKKKTEILSNSGAENDFKNEHAAVKSTNLESLGSTTVATLKGSSIKEEESSSSDNKKSEEDIGVVENENIASDADESEMMNAGHSTKFFSNKVDSSSAVSDNADANVSTSTTTANSSQRNSIDNNMKSVRISESNAAAANSTATNSRRLSFFVKNRKALKTETNEAPTDHSVGEDDKSAQVSGITTTKLSGLNKVVSQDTFGDEGAVETNESSSSDFGSRSRSKSFRSSSGRARYNGRAQYTNQGSNRNVNRVSNADQHSSKTEHNENGNTRTQTTYTQAYNNDGNTQKIVKRVHTKTIQKAEPEYEYVYEVITEKIPPSTRRPVTRNRGGVRFRDADLSSLLSLDFAAKSKRRLEGEKTIIKTRRKLIKKPAKTTESENVEEYEYEEQLAEQQATTRRTRPTPTEASTIISRPRPTRPLRTIKPTTQRVTDVEEENETQMETTTAASKPENKKGFEFKRPISKIVTSTTEEPLTTTTEAVFRTTRKGFAFQRPISTIKTTEAPVTTTTYASTETTIATPRPGLRRKIVKMQRPPNRTKFAESANVQEAIVKQAKVVTSSQESSATITTTKAPTTTTTEEPVTTTSSTEKTSTTTTTTPEEPPKTNTIEKTAIIITTTQTTDFADDSLDLLKKQFSNAITKLRENAEETPDSEAHTTVLTKTAQTTTTNTIGGETKTVTKTENEFTQNNSVSELNNELNETAEDASLSLPIYHRRKYYQYYKDSPVIYIGKPQPPTSAETSSVDIKKQIHEVFNISNDGNTSFASEELDNNSADVEITKADNSETDHFLLKTPGSK